MDIKKGTFWLTDSCVIVKALEDADDDTSTIRGEVAHIPTGSFSAQKVGTCIDHWYTMFIYKTYDSIEDALSAYYRRTDRRW